MKNNIREIYKKVSEDPALKAKFMEIMTGAETAGQQETGSKLLAFAKETGYDGELAEAREFFRDLAEKAGKGELSEMELDMVAGGKTNKGIEGVFVSIVTLGIACAAISIKLAAENSGDHCGDPYQ